MSGWTDFRDKLEGVAPTLLGALGTAAGGPLAGAAVGTLARALLGRPGTEKEVQEALLVATPEQLLALKQADNDFKAKMAELGFKEDELTVRDVQSARERDTAIWQSGQRNFRADILAYGALSGLLGCALLLFFVKLEPSQRETLLVILGALIALTKDVYGFEFGTTRGSKIKDETIASLSK